MGFIARVTICILEKYYFTHILGSFLWGRKEVAAILLVGGKSYSCFSLRDRSRTSDPQGTQLGVPCPRGPQHFSLFRALPCAARGGGLGSTRVLC